jgi:hypothetical protein
MKKLNAIPIKGRKTYSKFTSKLIKEMKIVAGSDIFKIKFFIPSFSNFPLNFFLSTIPKKIRRKKTIILEYI